MPFDRHIVDGDYHQIKAHGFPFCTPFKAFCSPEFDGG